MSVSYNQSFANEAFRIVLDRFQEANKEKKYTKRIEYKDWRTLQRSTIVRVSLEGNNLQFFDYFGRLLYKDSILDNGFGRFFYNKYIMKEKTKMDYTATSAKSVTISGDALNATTGTVSLNAEQLNSNGYYSTTGTIPVINTLDTNMWGTVALQSDTEELRNRVRKLENDMLNKVDKEKENETMIKGVNFDFGPCGSGVRLSMYGMAIQNSAGEWVSYNPATGEIINVDILNIADGGKYLYKMPVPISEVKVGDIVVHNRVPMFVTDILGNGTFAVTDVRAGESKTIIPVRNMFGFNFMTKVISLFGNMMGTPSADQPFGNMLPFLMMGEGKSMDNDAMLMFMLMQNQSNSNMFNNPMMMYFLMKDNKDFDPMMLMMMSMGTNQTPVIIPTTSNEQ